ncbi:MAG: aspartyl/asparaginyl beta-hydroxylase domain-containing protein [Acidobacteriota bacterium]
MNQIVEAPISGQPLIITQVSQNCLKTYQLPFHFDPRALQADLAQLANENWVAHFNRHYYEGAWSGVALRATDGLANRLFNNPNQRNFADTPALERCPNLQAVLANFHCPLTSVRLLKLAAGAAIREHSDPDLHHEYGEVRLHIPLLTNPQVEFFLAGERIVMNEGECWYLNLSLPHRVFNRGATDRIHLVVDCLVNDWLQTIIPFAAID